MGQTIEATFTPTKPETIMNLVGINDANLRLIEESYDVQVTDTGSEIEVTGEESIVKKIMQIFTALDKVWETLFSFEGSTSKRASTLKTEYNPSKKPRQSKRTDCRATEKRILE